MGSNKPDVVELPHLIPLVTTQLLFFAYSNTGPFAGILSQNTFHFDFTRQKTERPTFLTKWWCCIWNPYSCCEHPIIILNIDWIIVMSDVEETEFVTESCSAVHIICPCYHRLIIPPVGLWLIYDIRYKLFSVTTALFYVKVR